VIARLQRSLGARILQLAALNLLLLIAIGLAASGIRLPRNFAELVLQAAEPRLQDVARRIALDVEHTRAEDADALLERYGAEYRTRFMLARNDGTRIAGANLAVPEAVKHALAGPRRGEGRFEFRPPPEKGHPAGVPHQRSFPPTAPPDPQTGLRMPQTPAHLVSMGHGPGFWIVLRTPIRFAGEADIIAGSLLVVPYGLFRDPLLFPLRPLLWGLLALAVTVLCWWPMLRSLTRSLGQLEHATSEISQGRFNTRVGVTRTDEIGRLSAAIEQMAARLGQMVSGQKRFLGDTAHELRSPIGRMQIALEILNGRVSDAERAYVNDLKEDVDALRHLTDELLLYAEAELKERGGGAQLAELRPIVDRVVARESADATIVVDVPHDTTVRGDARLLERAIANVVRNAVKYAGSAGPIVIASSASPRSIALTVSDAGPGVAAESLERLFEPFFREDEARNRRTGGTGLGLAIVRSAVEACGGTVSCKNRDPHGLEVQLVLNKT